MSDQIALKGGCPKKIYFLEHPFLVKEIK